MKQQPTPNYIFVIYSEHERFVAYYSYTQFEIGDFLDKNNIVNASNELICSHLQFIYGICK